MSKMNDPVRATTGDPRFDPRKPVTVNGYAFAPVSPAVIEAVEIWATIKDLTEGEGNSVTVLCPNPDFNGQPNHAIKCNGDWTNWQDLRFAHDNRAECFRMALVAFRDHETIGASE